MPPLDFPSKMRNGGRAMSNDSPCAKKTSNAHRCSPAGGLWVMWLSLSVGVIMLGIKCFAYYITGSSAIFSDASESVVHNVAVGFALFSLWYSAQPADRNHPYGHDKIDFFSAGFEGALIVLVAFYIMFSAITKWMSGLALENLGAGLWLTVAAFVINSVLGAFLVARGRKTRSLVIVANGKHVLTDSWTSLGVIAGVLLAWWTGWEPFDPISAIVVAVGILWSGVKLMRQAFSGLMDEADPEVDRLVHEVLAAETKKYGAHFHEVRHRRAGRQTWVETHLLFPDETPVWAAHAQATEIERAVEKRLGPDSNVSAHIEPAHDHARVHGS